MKLKSLIATFLVCLNLCICSAAQTQGALPYPVQANIGPGSNHGCTFSTDCITTPEPVQAGNELVVCLMHNPNSSPPWTVIDDSVTTNSWTVEAVTGNTGTGGATNATMAIAHVVATHTQVLNIQIGFPGGTGPDNRDYVFSEWNGLSDTLDGGVLTSNSGSPLNAPVASDTHVTTTNGSVVIPCITTNISGNPTVVNNTGMILADQPNSGLVMGYRYTTSAGSYQVDGSADRGGTGTRVGIISAAFKPSTSLAIVDTKLPDCAVSVACPMQLHSVGGTSVPSYGVTAGAMPPGMSLASNGAISGSPTTAGTYSLTFQVTSGTLNAPKSLNIVVWPSFGTPTLVQTLVGDFNLGGNSSNFASPPQCGDVILMCMAAADDTHGTDGWLQKIDGANNYYGDGLGSPVQSINTFSGIRPGQSRCVVVGPLVASGTNFMKGFNNQSATSALGFAAYDLRNVQPLAEMGSYTSTTTSGTTSNPLTVPFSTLADNSFVAGIYSSSDPSGLLPAPTGFTADVLNGCFNQCNTITHNFITSAGAVNPTSNITNSTTSPDNNAGMMVALRPGPVYACPVSPGPRHRTDVK